MTDKNLAIRDKRYHESPSKKIFNRLLVILLKMISYLPFPVLYLISDGLYYLVKYVVRYRKKVILDNLNHAFPDKSAAEITGIMDGFYRHFCDLFLEIIKLHSMSEKEIEKRISFKGLDILNSLYTSGVNIVALAMHHNNWEWASVIHRKTHYTALMVYDPIRGNSAFEDFLIGSRTRFGGVCIPVHKAARTTMEFTQRGQPAALWLGADQTPPANSRFWTIFMNREAPFFSGPEKIAIKTGMPILFNGIRKTRRGFYEISFTPMFMNPKEHTSEEIMMDYITRIEESIREQPETYLWSHRRWKHKRPPENQLIPRPEVV